jgi:uncharacterized protein (DUF1800 family)
MPPSIVTSKLDLTPYKGNWDFAAVKHLLQRTMFGSANADIQYFLAKDLKTTIDELLNPVNKTVDPPLNDYTTTTVLDPNVKIGTTWINDPTNDGTLNSYRRASFKKWWVGQMINQDRSIKEKMSLFWANHFGTEVSTISISHYVYQHHSLLRNFCLGNFKQLVKLVTVDAGMLRFLNGYLNTNTSPDENYGRELQELFTIGKDTEIRYTEDDVKAAAKILTGWRINSSFQVYFDATKHDSSNKQFSSFYNNKIITGKTSTNGQLETDDLLDMIFSKTEVAKYICRKIYRWFVFYQIDADVEKNIITPLASLFIQSNFEIKPVLKALLSSEHFFDIQNRGSQIKSPIDHVIGCIRQFNIVFPDASINYVDAYSLFNSIVSQLISFGQDPGEPPNVAGWQAYYQTPDFYELWINADTLPKRNKLTDLFVNTGYTKNTSKIIIDTIKFAKEICTDPSDPNLLVNTLFSYLLSTEVLDNTKQNLKKQILLSGQISDYYWTEAWNSYQTSPTTINLNIVTSRLKALIKYILNTPDYQLA